MTRLRWTFVLAILFVWTGSLHAAELDSPEATAIGHLSQALATRDAARITHAYRAMGAAARPAAKIVEATVNQLGYELLRAGDIEAAIKVFELNSGTFPLSANGWDSLAEAKRAYGDYDTATRFFKVARHLEDSAREKKSQESSTG
ncbi:MAG: hypothetical protein KJO82_05875 [Gammaproteobacteria bacterium]|nr:hypothetical protein [Gammaproteobacteria bacterium]